MKGNIHYIRVGDYEIPDLKLPEETRSIGHLGRMHRDYLREYHPIRFNSRERIQGSTSAHQPE